MKCVICKHGTSIPGTTTVMLEVGETTLVIKGVPADICDNCGESYLSDEVSDRIMELAKEAEKAGAQVDVRKYRAA